MANRLAECCDWCGHRGPRKAIKLRGGPAVTLCERRCVVLIRRAFDGDPDAEFMLRALTRRLGGAS